VNADVETLILYSPNRLDALYGAGSFATANLTTTLTALAAHGQVNGELINLDNYPELTAAYLMWDNLTNNPQAANFVAQHIKTIIYTKAEAYPNLKYLVLVGGDPIIPHGRLRDEAKVANERNYSNLSGNQRLSLSQFHRYMLSDDYYAGLLPLPWRGRELYLPQLAVGRLVETPAEIAFYIDNFLANPVLEPQDALVTGYEFLLDQAGVISATLDSYGVAPIQTLINDDWTADDFRTLLFTRTVAHNLISLNSHFQHNLFFPNNPENVYATEIMATTTYTASLIFSVGCHSGLNVADPGLSPCLVRTGRRRLCGKGRLTSATPALATATPI
jgi:hypothetical protein